MILQVGTTPPNFEAETTEGPVRFHDWIDYRGLTPDQRQRVMQLVIRDAQAARAQAPHDLGGAGLRALQAAAGGGAAIIRLQGGHCRGRQIVAAPTPSDAHASQRYASFTRSMTARSPLGDRVGGGPRPRCAAGSLGLTVAKQPHVEFRRKAAPHTKG